MNKNYLWIAGIIALILIISQTKKESGMDGSIVSCSVPSNANTNDQLSIDCTIKNEAAATNDFVFEIADGNNRLGDQYLTNMAGGSTVQTHHTITMPNHNWELIITIYKTGLVIQDQHTYTIYNNALISPGYSQFLGYKNTFLSIGNMLNFITNANAWLNECDSSCSGKSCGDNGCGGSCGTCSTGYECKNWQCACIPVCSGKSCGDNGCGGSCGTCSTGYTCNNQQCVQQGHPGYTYLEHFEDSIYSSSGSFSDPTNIFKDGNWDNAIYWNYDVYLYWNGIPICSSTTVPSVIYIIKMGFDTDFRTMEAKCYSYTSSSMISIGTYTFTEYWNGNIQSSTQDFNVPSECLKLQNGKYTYILGGHSAGSQGYWSRLYESAIDYKCN